LYGLNLIHPAKGHFYFYNFNLDNKFLNPAEQAFFMEKQEDALIAYYDQLEPEYAQILED